MANGSVVTSGKFSGEEVEIIIDFTSSLVGNETLTGTPAIAVAVNSGIDVAPGDILNGAASIDGNLVVVPVKGGIKNCSYLIKATCNTTNNDKILEMIAVLPINPQ